LATHLSDLLEDIVVVGGLVPSLLAMRDASSSEESGHVGTHDLDLGLSVALFRDARYAELCRRLESAGFTRALTATGTESKARWRRRGEGSPVIVDFLIAPLSEEDRGGASRHLTGRLAALVTPGLEMAFADCESVTLVGTTLDGAEASRVVRVCGPGAFVLLKALAFGGCGEPKDAYDLHFVLSEHPAGIDDVARRIASFAESAALSRALNLLREEFCAPDALGPVRAAHFLSGGPDGDVQADVAGGVGRLLELVVRGRC
jgi:hypothetical protein